MIIPVKCFTCGNVLANKYEYYINKVTADKIKDGIEINKVVYLSKQNVEKTHEAKVLDELQLFKMCCRRHMLTHVDIE